MWTALWAAAGPGVLLAQPSPTAILDGLRADARRPIDFHAAVFPDTVYVGQQVTYQVAVLLSEQARSRLRRNPEFLPPELRGLLAYELGTPRHAAPRTYGEGVFEAHVFQRALFAVKPGAVEVPAPQLSYSLPQSASYFSKEESFVVRGESARVVVRPLPDEGRPAEFTGAVGVLRATTRVDAAAARVGDPLVLTVRVEGRGNVKLLPRPTLELSWATVVAGSERVQVDSSGPSVRGAKEFDYLLTPSQAGAAVLPRLRYSYFDPYRGEYAWAETMPADVMIAEGALAVPVAGEEPATLPLRPWRRQEASPPSSWSRVRRVGGGAFWLLAPLPALLALWQRRRRGQMSAARSPGGDGVQRPERPHDASPAGEARRVRRLTLEHLATRLEIPVFALTGRRDVEQALRRRGVTRSTTRDVLTLLDDLARRGFGAPPMGEQEGDATALQAQADAVLERVHTEAVGRGRARRWARRAPSVGGTTLAGWLSLAGLAVAGLPHGRLTAQSSASFPVLVQEVHDAPGGAGDAALERLVQDGMAAFEGGRYQQAAERLGEAAAGRPFDTDLLVNWGTAAWVAGDTVSAVMAWQRGARLDPLAADLQERLRLLPSSARGPLGDVPMVPVSSLAIGGTVLWALGWALLFGLWRRPPRDDKPASATRRTMGGLLVILGLVSGSAAWWGTRALDGRGLAIVRRPDALRQQPGFSANTVGGVGTGDLVQLTTTQEGWARVTHNDGRRGWLPVSQLAPLVPPSVAR